MKTTRRQFVMTAGAGALGARLLPALAGGRAVAVSPGKPDDVAVVGAGVPDDQGESAEAGGVSTHRGPAAVPFSTRALEHPTAAVAASFSSGSI